jgi:hypothetical protein
MLILDIEVDLGAHASPAQIEQLVRGVRVAVDVGRSASNRRIRREASNKLRFPTEDELLAALERFPRGDERSAWYRAKRHLELRQRLDSEYEGMPPEFWFDRVYRRKKKGPGNDFARLLAETGSDRLFSGTGWPFSGGNPGLDVTDPALYQALVEDEVARYTAGEVFVREVRYRNPFGEEIAGIGKAVDAVKKTAGVIETLATINSRRRKTKAEADVAEALVPTTIEDGRLDLEFKREMAGEQLRAAQIANEIAEEELVARRIENNRSLRLLSLEARRQALSDRALLLGQLDIADAVAELEPGDAEALGELVSRAPQMEERIEPDPVEEV